MSMSSTFDVLLSVRAAEYGSLLNSSAIVFSFEKDNSAEYKRWMTDNWTLSVYASLAYVLFIAAGQLYMRDRPRFEIRNTLFIWNVGLAVFSILGVVRSCPHYLDTLFNRGFQATLCTTDFYDTDVVGFWSYAFVVSKIFELGDTAFIVFRKQKLIFLHWYHHVTVLIYCWYTYPTMNSPGRWYAGMNYAVHSVMYTYYALRALRVHIPRSVSMAITCSQIVQMVVGLGVLIAVAWVKLYKPEASCPVQMDSVWLGIVMYGSYLVLFVQFFLSAYIVPKARAIINERKRLASGSSSSEKHDAVPHYSNGYISTSAHDSETMIPNRRTTTSVKAGGIATGGRVLRSRATRTASSTTESNNNISSK